jgi:hypothetical protein
MASSGNGGFLNHVVEATGLVTGYSNAKHRLKFKTDFLILLNA